MTLARSKQITAMATGLAMLALPAFAETMQFTADLNAASEVPPNDSAATGTAEVTIDSEAMTVSWTVTHDGLTGDASAAHIHGPASETENAPPIVTLDPIEEGSAEITEEQISEVEAGRTYVNVHTEQYPDGEIRGQLMKAE